MIVKVIIISPICIRITLQNSGSFAVAVALGPKLLAVAN